MTVDGVSLSGRPDIWAIVSARDSGMDIGSHMVPMFFCHRTLLVGSMLFGFIGKSHSSSCVCLAPHLGRELIVTFFTALKTISATTHKCRNCYSPENEDRT